MLTKKNILTLCFCSAFLPFIGMSQWAQIGSNIEGEAVEDRSGTSISLSSDGSTVAIGAGWNDGVGSKAGHVRVYQNFSGTWAQIGSDIDGEATLDEFGSSVSLSDDGSILAVGARGNNNTNGNDAGHVRIYKNASGIWSQIGSNIEGEAASDQFGYSLSLNGNGSIIAVGSLLNDGNGSNSGSVRVFKNISGTWTQSGTDINGPASSSRFGRSVSLNSDGNIFVAGAANSNEVLVFENISGVWTQVGTTISGSGEFGNSVSINSDGNIIAVGAHFYSGGASTTGLARVFENVSGTWIQVGSDIEGAVASDQLGESVSLNSDGSVLAVGSVFFDGAAGTNSGHARVYKNDGGFWTQIDSFIEGEAEWDIFGGAISLSSNGDVLAVGATLNDGNGSNSGHVQVYNNQNIQTNIVSNSIEQSLFRIYPNPADNQLTIEGKEFELNQIRIYNTVGQLVISNLRGIAKTTNQLTVNISDLTPGIYFLKIKSTTYKLYKQ